MIGKLEFVLAIIVIALMAAYFATDIYLFGQISVTVALVNFMVGIIRCAGEEKK